VDIALQRLVDETFGPSPSICLTAVGGYGRGELSPHSDIDIVILLPPRSDVSKATLRGLLYPLWDAGWRVGHAVRTPKGCITHATGDLEAATSLLSARFITGSKTLHDEVIDRRAGWIRKNRKRLTRSILDETARRHDRSDRAGWSLAPDLKIDVGGIRDIHTVGWLNAVSETHQGDHAPLAESNELMLVVREALHAELKRPGDRLRIDLQPAVANRLGFDDPQGADVLMARVHSSARNIEQIARAQMSRTADSVMGGPRRSGSVVVVDNGVVVADGVLALSGPPEGSEVSGALKLLAGGAETNRPIASRLHPWLNSVFAAREIEWDESIRSAWFQILRGRFVVGALELLDHVGGITKLIPEWQAIQGRALYDPYHRFTVDGHSFLAVAEVHRALESDSVAARAAADAGGIDTLLLAALLHDIGKGSGESHSIAGARIARSVCRRMGLSSEQSSEVETLVRHHLLLSDTATRRDLDDGGVIAGVAESLADARLLRLLYVLSIADGRATGPEAWTEWKSALVVELFRKALIAIETGELPTRSNTAERARAVEMFEPALAGRTAEVLETLPPSYVESTSVEDMADELGLLLNPPPPGEVRHRVQADRPDRALLTVCMNDRPGTLARTAAVLAIHRASVLKAQAFSTTTGLALERLVLRPGPTTKWAAVGRDLKAAFSGRLAVDPHLERKAQDYAPTGPVTCEVRVLHDASAHSTVIEVRAPDALGVLYAIASGISDLDLDIHVAKIDTLGERVVDVFYVRTPSGDKLDEVQATEVERSIAHRFGRIYG
jgi:[protein-PII] uridylyltransferase